MTKGRRFNPPLDKVGIWVRKMASLEASSWNVAVIEGTELIRVPSTTYASMAFEEYLPLALVSLPVKWEAQHSFED